MNLQGATAIITGGGGLLGEQHAAALGEEGCNLVLLDVDQGNLATKAKVLQDRYGVSVVGEAVDITREDELQSVGERVKERFGSIDILVNNAARNPKVEGGRGGNWSRLETLSIDEWRMDLEVGLTGALLCSRVFGTGMARRGKGVILNIASDLAVIAPDQRIYRDASLPDDLQPVKPVAYSVVKSGLIGLTRYLATYWAECGVRVNALSPGGVYNNQPPEFVARLSQLIPLGRMARVDEYRKAIVFLCSDASSYMTGQNLVMDGGRSCW